MSLDERVLNETTALTFAGKMPFPEVVKRLMDMGVERYCADLVTLQKIFYNAQGAHATVNLPLENPAAIALRFDQAGVQAAIRASQQGQIQYPEFLRRVMAAGVVFYDVFMGGRKAIYMGRNGDFHVENFPGQTS